MARKPKEEEGNFDWLEPSPVFVDHYALQVFRYSGIVRMAFGEYVGRNETPIYRVGLAMPIADAKSFLETLDEAIKDAESALPPTAPAEEEQEVSLPSETPNDT